MPAMDRDLRTEVEINYDFFQRNLGNLIVDHVGQYALLKSAKIIGFYPGPGEAFRGGIKRFPDRIFSIQQVSDEPVEMGLMSVALA
jgi:hypothetical protein